MTPSRPISANPIWAKLPFLLLPLTLLGCAGAQPQTETPVAISTPVAPDPCALVPRDPNLGPRLFFATDAAEGSGSFVAAQPFAPGARFAVVADAWTVPEELPPLVTVTSSTAIGDGTFTVRFSYAQATSEPMAVVGPTEPSPTALSGRLGTGLPPAAVSIGVPQITYELTLPEGQHLSQKMVRCTQDSYVEQIWLESESDADGPVLISNERKTIAPPGPDLAAVPTRATHLFYVHGAIVQTQGPDAVSAEFGQYRFRDIVAALGETSAQVHATLRAKDTSLEQGVRALSDEIRALLVAGVDPYDITVVGASQGGLISLMTSSNLANPRLSFVILGACSSWAESHLKLNLHGRILSIYEQGDRFGSSCSALAKRSRGVTAYREIPLHTGLRHGFLYRPLPEWINPTLRWQQHLNVAPWGP